MEQCERGKQWGWVLRLGAQRLGVFNEGAASDRGFQALAKIASMQSIIT
jgi:hypothetical protein